MSEPVKRAALLPWSDGPDAASASARTADPASASKKADATSAAFARLGPRAAAHIATIALAGALGWWSGSQSSSQVAVHSAFASQTSEISAALGRVEGRLASAEKAIGHETEDAISLRRAVDVLARRVDELGRSQTAAASQLRSGMDRADKEAAAKTERLAERLDRLEKQLSSQTPTASIPKANVTTAPKTIDAPAADKAEAAAIPVRGYVLREVFRGGALVESRRGLLEVYPGLELPGAGRVRSVEKRNGKWVVVTTAGVIDSSPY